MQLLLPPSEAKTTGGRARPLSGRDPHAALGDQRRLMIAALDTLVKSPAADAAKALLLPSSAVAAALAANSAILSSRTMPALQRYAGVVYEGLAFSQLDQATARAALRTCFVFSGLFGVVRGDEAIPDYRVPAKAVLPGVGIAGTAWRPVLDAVLPTFLGRGLIVDLRSSDYQAMWRPPKTIAKRVVTVRVLSPLPGGGVGVVSYPSKYAKGQLAAALAGSVAAGQRPRAAADVIEIWQRATGLRGKLVSANQIELFTATTG